MKQRLNIASILPPIIISQRAADLEGPGRDEGDVVVVQGERLEGGQRAERPLRQELEAVLVQVDGGRLAGELSGQLGHAGAVAQHAAALLLRARAGGRTRPLARPAGERRRGQQAEHRDWGGGENIKTTGSP